jgi:putative heme iron utilization protein
MTEKKELSQLAKTILSGSGHITTFTQTEFDEALALAKAEIMMVAIETTKKAIFIERQACAEVVSDLAAGEDEGEVATALKNASEAILNRIPSQRQ